MGLSTVGKNRAVSDAKQPVTGWSSACRLAQAHRVGPLTVPLFLEGRILYNAFTAYDAERSETPAQVTADADPAARRRTR